MNGVVTMCRSGSAACNKRPTWRGTPSAEVAAHAREGGARCSFLHFLLNFPVNLELLHKIKSTDGGRGGRVRCSGSSQSPGVHRDSFNHHEVSRSGRHR